MPVTKQLYPKISIVTPSFNQGKYIEQTILSVINQKYPNLEYIIIDGGSTDNTVEIIEKYEQHIHYWISEPDKGQTDAINKGFAKCSGEIFNWINSDDYYEQGAFEKIALLFTNRPDINVVCGREWSFEDDNPDSKSLHTGSILKANVYETIRIGIIDQPCTFFRKKKIDTFFPLAFSLKYVMDKQLWWSYLLKFGQTHILQTAEVFTWFRLHTQSKSIQQAAFFKAEEDLLLMSLFRQLEAPSILKEQLNVHNETSLHTNWEILIPESKNILAAFATYFAVRYYVKDDWQTTAQLIKLVKQWKKANMNRTEWKLCMITCLLPAPISRFIKKLKK